MYIIDALTYHVLFIYFQSGDEVWAMMWAMMSKYFASFFFLNCV